MVVVGASLMSKVLSSITTRASHELSERTNSRWNVEPFENGYDVNVPACNSDKNNSGVLIHFVRDCSCSCLDGKCHESCQKSYDSSHSQSLLTTTLYNFIMAAAVDKAMENLKGLCFSYRKSSSILILIARSERSPRNSIRSCKWSS